MNDAGRERLERARRAPLGGVVDDTPITVGGRTYRRLMIKTHVVLAGEDLAEVVARYANPHLAAGDIVFVSEKAAAAAQGRAIPVETIRPRPLARFLASRVKRVPYGFGLGRPETMEMAIREAGAARILFAAAVHAVTRLFGRSGDFYRIAGRRVASIDGPTAWAQPPFDRCVTLAPLHTDETCEAIVRRLRLPAGAAIVDVNDIGSEVLGASRDVDRALVRAALRDNPLGQGPFQTPIGLLRADDRVVSGST